MQNITILLNSQSSSGSERNSLLVSERNEERDVHSTIANSDSLVCTLLLTRMLNMSFVREDRITASSFLIDFGTELFLNKNPNMILRKFHLLEQLAISN